MRKLVDAIKNLFIGLFTTGKHIPRGRITLQYPTERWVMPERSRGIVVLLSDKETGDLNCTTCLLCERACPTAAIKIEYEKDEKKKRHLKDFIVNHGLCCFCGLCEEACNFAAIKMATKYEFSTTDKNDLIWHTDKLQEMGRDVPYEKPVRKRPAAKPAPPKPAADASKPVVSKPDQSSESTEKPETESAASPTQADDSAGEQETKPEADSAGDEIKE